MRKIAIIAAIATVLLYLVGIRDTVDIYIKTLALMVTISTLIPMFLVRKDIEGKRDHGMAVLPIIGMIYAVYYGLPILFTDYLEVRRALLSLEAVQTALEIALFGWFSLLLGYYIAGNTGGTAGWNWQLTVNEEKRIAGWLIAVGGCIAIIFEYFDTPATLRQPIRFLIALSQLGIGLLLVLTLRKKIRSSYRKVIWIVVMPVFLLIQLPGGLVSVMIFASIYITIIYWEIRGRIPIVFLVIVAIAAVILRPAMDEYRDLTWGDGPYAGSTRIEKGLLLADLAIANVTEEGGDYGSSAVDRMAKRTAQLGTLAWVVDLTPDKVPYWQGETYLSFFASFIPRAVWPDKPGKDLGQRFGHRYGLIDSWDTSTSVNLPQLVEGYANFGFIGVLLEMLIIGAIYRVLENALCRNITSDAGIVLSAFIIMQLVNLESDFSLVFGGIMQSIIVLYIITNIIGKSEKVKRVYV